MQYSQIDDFNPDDELMNHSIKFHIKLIERCNKCLQKLYSGYHFKDKCTQDVYVPHHQYIVILIILISIILLIMINMVILI